MKFRALIALSFLASVACAHAADIEVRDAWVRGTVPGQQSSGAFLTVTSAKDATLLGASSPVARTVEIHEMKMADGVMKMRPVSKVALPAGKPVDLAGDYHIMLMGLNKSLDKGDTVPLRLKVKVGGKTETVKLKAEVRDLTGDSAH